MEEIYIEDTLLSPKIILNKQENFFFIYGKSIIENAEEFYYPVHNWFKEYYKNPNKKTEIIFFLEYFNSATSLQIGNLIELFMLNKNISNHRIDWLFESNDELTKDVGKEFQYIYEFKFNFIEVTEKDLKIFDF